ncbi:MAG: amidase [Rhodospirillales bacterium]|jgi:Asp-tRNA(Asn)/Glu-tRNA(Gln) amidotransferase A subunit family amidase|nr:amidase [Rhodospirillales bacterium]
MSNGHAELISRDAKSAAAAIRQRRITSEELTGACLDRIRQSEDQVRAWAFIDPDQAIRQARAADQAINRDGPRGPLHGVPIGLKDIFDTADMPTENGTVLDSGRRPSKDAAVVSLLRDAGAVILGKTVTTELATYAPGPTTNPRDPSRSPGGSSSGSAAAVADAMVPLALGTQTNGSGIRPAASCGVVGFKPTRGTIDRTGVLMQSSTLDQVGVFANTVADAALLAQTIMSAEADRGDAPPLARPDLLDGLAAPLGAKPLLAFARSPVWEEAEPAIRDIFLRWVESPAAGGLPMAELPAVCDEAVACHRTIGEVELSRAYHCYYEKDKTRLSAQLRGMVERGRMVSASAYDDALAGMAAIGNAMRGIFSQFDALVTPATTGEAPVGLAATGSPIFCTLWTLCGLPCITLPLLSGPSGMPLGVQIVGPLGGDAKLLRIAQWLIDNT